jgi:hypothetical protein
MTPISPTRFRGIDCKQLASGIILGAAIGTATGNLAVGLAIAAAFGLFGSRCRTTTGLPGTGLR